MYKYWGMFNNASSTNMTGDYYSSILININIGTISNIMISLDPFRIENLH